MKPDQVPAFKAVPAPAWFCDENHVGENVAKILEFHRETDTFATVVLAPNKAHGFCDGDCRNEPN
jgi:hypothetical protein